VAGVRRAIACLLAGGLLLAAAGCGDEAEGPPPTARVIDCGLTNPQAGQAEPYAVVRVTNPDGTDGRVRVVIRFVADGAGIGRGEATSIASDGGGTTQVNVVGPAGAAKVDTCEVADVERV
jgi:hypothetical protein